LRPSIQTSDSALPMPSRQATASGRRLRKAKGEHVVKPGTRGEADPIANLAASLSDLRRGEGSHSLALPLPPAPDPRLHWAHVVSL
jgi:hypothetical protein